MFFASKLQATPIQPYSPAGHHPICVQADPHIFVFSGLIKRGDCRCALIPDSVEPNLANPALRNVDGFPVIGVGQPPEAGMSTDVRAQVAIRSEGEPTAREAALQNLRKTKSGRFMHSSCGTT